MKNEYNNFVVDDNVFLTIALFNTFIGLQNSAKNTEQVRKQRELEIKIDKILEIIGKDYE